MSELSIRQAVVNYAERTALAGLTLNVSAGETVAVLGPSGCGKSTLLRAVAGLEPLTQGEIVLDGRDLAGVPTYRRQVGLMFSDHALFPHLNVAENVGFGLRMGKWSKPEIADRVTEMLSLVGLVDRADSVVTELSGGQAQRVALARTLAPQPAVVLLDEPMSSLDRALRRDLTETLAQSLDQAGATAVLVTHDRDEALRLGDRVAVMRDGSLVQVDTGAHLLAHPANEWVADFLSDSPNEKKS
ncbi:MAG: hypothetical protein CMH41_06245 [Micrococcales bacterium]|nr:hypothetical protein [Micrococcales bacterium]